jgi:DNA-binding beta-propeller fold protein YncE
LCAGVPAEKPTGLAVLGDGTHAMDAVQMTVIGTAKDGLAVPRDLAFNPNPPGGARELWVVNWESETMVVFDDPGEAGQASSDYHSGDSAHFFARPAGLAFGAPGTLGTIHETDQPTQGEGGTEPDFMGPTLFTSERGDFNAGQGGHLDMLHNSPNGMGIAWEAGNTYWVFDGYHGSLTRYNFVDDHGLGGTDHEDGTVYRYVEGEVKRVPQVSSHLAYHAQSKRLFVADTGNQRIAVLDTATGKPSSTISPNYDGTIQKKVSGATLETLVDGAVAGLQKPSGLEVSGDLIFVTDNATSKILAFERETGTPSTGSTPGFPRAP